MKNGLFFAFVLLVLGKHELHTRFALRRGCQIRFGRNAAPEVFHAIGVGFRFG